MIGVWSKLYFPRDDKLYIEADLNMTIPSFTPMILQVKLHEKRISEYDVSDNRQSIKSILMIIEKITFHVLNSSFLHIQYGLLARMSA